MKASEMTGVALDWAVAKCELLRGEVYTLAIDTDIDGTKRVNYGGMYPEWSTDWSEGGAIIEREWVNLDNGSDLYPNPWGAAIYDENGDAIRGFGETPLIAAMRCYVASKLGDEVEIPEELK
jgi:hypothetical protein